MKFSIQAKALATALKSFRGVVEKRNTIPILSHVFIRVSEDNKIDLRATDLDISLELSFAAEVVEAGETTVAWTTFEKIAGKAGKAADITVTSTENERLTVQTGRSRFTLPTLPATDFPSIDQTEITHTIELPGVDLERLFGDTNFAASTEETRYYLNGVYLTTTDKTMRAVSTDGTRLARVDTPRPESFKTGEIMGPNGTPGLIVPRKTVEQVSSLFIGLSPVKVIICGRTIGFEHGGMRLVSKLIDGTFPDYARVIPTGNNMLLRVSRDEIVEAIDRVAIVTSERGSAIRFTADGGILKLSVHSTENGTAYEELEVDYTAEPIEIGLNSRLLSEMLGHFGGESIEIAMFDPSSPIIVRQVDDESALFVQMPMRI